MPWREAPPRPHSSVSVVLLFFLMQAPLINAPFFSLPQAGTSALMERSAKLLNSRAVSFTNDIVYEIPCAPSMPACPAKPSGLLGSVRQLMPSSSSGFALPRPAGSESYPRVACAPCSTPLRLLLLNALSQFPPLPAAGYRGCADQPE